MRLGDIANIQIGKTPSTAVGEYWGAGYDWLAISDLNNLHRGKYPTKSAKQITQAAIEGAGMKLVPENAILYSFKLSIGKVAITTKPVYTNEAIASIIIKPSCEDLVNLDYLMYALKYADTSNLIDHAAKGKTLNKSKLSEIDVYIPSLNEQLDIVQILDQINIIKEKSTELAGSYRRMSEAKFTQLFGDLYYNTHDYPEKPLKELVVPGTTISYGILQPGDNNPDGVYIINSGDIKHGNILQNKLAKTSTQINESNKKTICNAEDIIISIRASIGSAAILPKELAGANIARGVARIATNRAAVNLYYLYNALISNGIQAKLQKQAKGATFKEITLDMLRETRIPLPPSDEQDIFEKIHIQISELIKKNESIQKYAKALLASTVHAIFINKQALKNTNVIFSDDFEKEELINRINNNEFKTFEEYDLNKEMLFSLLSSVSSDVSQFYDNQSKSVKIKK
ncbi:restriction endonuclease subunit S [Hymenobacter koreensis]|uniref:Type I restriction modification DNA specificity domain-containing protein n=1 Tax=Hymenobacter koreensis TaxID=1084523 RepID=A0ABP8IY62_9BACT